MDCPLPSPRDLPNPGLKSGSPALWTDALPPEPPGKPKQCKPLSRVRLFAIPGPLQSMEFFRPDTGVGSCSLFQGISQPRDQTQVSCIAGRFLPAVPPGKPKNTGVDSLSLLQQVFPTQEPNRGLLHCRQILYQLCHQGSPRILEWIAYSFSSTSSQPRNPTRVSCIAGRFFTRRATREVHMSL